MAYFNFTFLTLLIFMANPNPFLRSSKQMVKIVWTWIRPPLHLLNLPSFSKHFPHSQPSRQWAWPTFPTLSRPWANCGANFPYASNL